MVCDDVISWSVSIVIVMLILWSARFPRICWILLVVDPVCFMIGDISRIIMFCVLMAIAVLSYDGTNARACGIVALMTAIQAMESVLSNDGDLPLHSLPSYVVMYVLMALLGCSLRWREQWFADQRKVDRLRAQMAEIHRVERLSASLHDAVTGELSYIVRTAHCRANGERQTAGCGDWARIETSAMQALEAVHRVIDAMDGSLDGTEDLDTADAAGSRQAADDLIRRLERRDAQMAALGFQGQGVCHISSVPSALSASRWSVTTGLVEEVYTNIIRHGSPAGRYQVSVSWESAGVRVIAGNDTASEGAALNVEFPGGTGLHRYRRLVERARGTFCAERVAGQWQVQAFVPAGNTSKGRYDGA